MSGRPVAELHIRRGGGALLATHIGPLCKTGQADDGPLLGCWMVDYPIETLHYGRCTLYTPGHFTLFKKKIRARSDWLLNISLAGGQLLK